MRTSNHEIENLLRARIVRSELRPGARFPPRTDLVKDLGTSLATLQRAMTGLERDGFIWTRAGVGTFVSDVGPHQNCFGLVFPPPYDYRPVWHEKLMLSAERIAQEGQYRFVSYQNITGHADNAEYQRLVDDMRKRRLAGLLFFYADIERLAHTPLIQETGVVRVLEGRNREGTNLPMVHGDWGGWTEQALERLAEAGCRRPAAIIAAGLRDVFEKHWQAAGQRLGLTLRDHWLQTPLVETTSTTRCTRLLFDRRDGPDGLVITHATYEAGAFAGLGGAGLIPGVDVPVVVHTEIPCEQNASRGITRLGFDTGDVLRTMLVQAEKQLAGEEADPVTLVPPVEVGRGEWSRAGMSRMEVVQ